MNDQHSTTLHTFMSMSMPIHREDYELLISYFFQLCQFGQILFLNSKEHSIGPSRTRTRIRGTSAKMIKTLLHDE